VRDGDALFYRYFILIGYLFTSKNFRIGFYLNYEYKYFCDAANQEEDISIAVQEMAKLASTVNPLVPKDYYFNSKELKDFIFTSCMLSISVFLCFYFIDDLP
jgi:hypothetical protein